MTKELLLVVQQNDHSLGYYDAITGAELDRIEVEPLTPAFALNRDGRYAYLGHAGATISVVDVPQRRRIGTLDCGDWPQPVALALDAVGSVYALSAATDHLLVWRTPAAGGLPDVVLPTGGAGAHSLTVTHDARQVFVSNGQSATVTVLVPTAPELPPMVIPVGAQPAGLLLDAAEARLYVGDSSGLTVIDVATLTLLPALPLATGATRLCWDGRGRLLVLLAEAAALAVIDPQHPNDAACVALPARPLAVSYDALLRRAFVSGLDQQVYSVDSDRLSIAETIPTRPGPVQTALVRLEWH